jgi:uncharacterized membrane protein YebE (DUF533 family)
MKKIVFLILVAAAGYVGYKTLQSYKENQELWDDVTDLI